VLQRAESPEVAARYAAHTVAARARGVFGSPSFVTADGEVFWGDDRLEEALEWVGSGR
jgi:2-hydroxychromene-2-carboxylate isomerase